MKSRLHVILIIERNGKILLGRKAPGIGPYPRKWLIPGGGVNEDNESLDDAMKRELFEETGLQVTKFKKMFFNEDIAERKGEMTRLIYLYYKIIDCSNWENLRPGDDLVELEWFSLKGIRTVDVPSISLKTFTMLGYI